MPQFAELDIRILAQDAQGFPVEFEVDGASQIARGHLDPARLPIIPAEMAGDNGNRLGEWFFADPQISAAWTRLQGAHAELRIRLRIDADAPALHALPWESLTIPASVGQAAFDAVHGRAAPWSVTTSTPFSRYLAGAFPRAAPVSPPLRLLVAVAAPDGLSDYGLTPVDADAEWTELQHALKGLDIQVTRLAQPCTPAALEEALRTGYHLVHLVSHGLFDQQSGHASLVLADDQNRPQFVADTEIAAMLGRLTAGDNGLGDLRLIFLASCLSAARSPTDAFRGLAPQLMLAGVPAVMAMQELVPVTTAQAFSATFYRRLSAHGVVDLAANEARATLLTAAVGGAAIPVLFMRLRNGQLWADTQDAGSRMAVTRRTVHVGSLELPTPVALGALLLLLVLLLGTGYLVRNVDTILGVVTAPTATPAPTPTPNSMAGEFNVAIADFGVLGADGAVVDSEFGRALSQSIYSRLIGEYAQLSESDAFDTTVDIWHDSSTDPRKNVTFGLIHGADEQARAAVAGELATKVGADLVVYGYLTGETSSDDLVVEFFYRSPTLRADPDAAYGRHVFGSVNIPVAYATDPTLAKGRMQSILEPRIRGLFWITVALVYDKVGEQENALKVLLDAEKTLTDWPEEEGKEVLYYFIGRQAYWLRDYNMALDYLLHALELNDTYVSALQSLGVTLYDRAALFAANNPQGQAALEGCVSQAEFDNAAATAQEAATDLAQSISFQQEALALAQTDASPSPRAAGLSQLALGLAYTLQGQTALQAGDAPGALPWLSQADEQLTGAWAAFAGDEVPQFQGWTNAARGANELVRAQQLYATVRTPDGSINDPAAVQEIDEHLQQSIAEFSACVDAGALVADPVFQREVVDCGCAVYLDLAQSARTMLVPQ